MALTALRLGSITGKKHLVSEKNYFIGTTALFVKKLIEWHQSLPLCIRNKYISNSYPEWNSSCSTWAGRGGNCYWCFLNCGGPWESRDLHKRWRNYILTKMIWGLSHLIRRVKRCPFFWSPNCSCRIYQLQLLRCSLVFSRSFHLEFELLQSRKHVYSFLCIIIKYVL